MMSFKVIFNSIVSLKQIVINLEYYLLQIITTRVGIYSSCLQEIWVFYHHREFYLCLAKDRMKSALNPSLYQIAAQHLMSLHCLRFTNFFTESR